MRLIESPDFALTPSVVDARQAFRSAMRKFVLRQPGAGVFLTDDEIKAVVDDMNKYLHLTPMAGGKP